MASYDTDSAINATFSLDFYAATSGDADTAANSALNRIFGAPAAALFNLVSKTNVALSGQDITGANYTFTWALDFRMGGSTAATPFYNTIAATTAANALAVLQANAQRATNITNFPLQVLYLKAE